MALQLKEKRIARRMQDAGREISEIAERLGKTRREVEIYFTRLETLRRIRMTVDYSSPVQSNQLCWSCWIATGRPSRRTGEPCPWVPKGSRPGRHDVPEPPTPVEGWDAVPAVRRTQDGQWSHEIESYVIRGCPLYEEDA